MFAIVPFPKGCRITTKMVGQDLTIENVIFQVASDRYHKGFDLLGCKGYKVVDFSNNGGETYVDLRNSDEVDKLNAALQEGECLIGLRKIQWIFNYQNCNKHQVCDINILFLGSVLISMFISLNSFIFFQN